MDLDRILKIFLLVDLILFAIALIIVALTNLRANDSIKKEQRENIQKEDNKNEDNGPN